MYKAGSATNELEIRRYRAAVAELRAAGLYTSFRNYDGPSWSERAFQSGRPMEYLPLRQNLISQGSISVVACSVLYLPVYLFNPDLALTSAISMVFYGAVLPLVATTMGWREAQSHGLTRWEDLAS